MLPVITKSSPPHKRLLFSLAIVGLILGSTSTITPAEIISTTNAARQSAGLNPVHPDERLMAAAEAKAKAMLAAGAWSHDTPSETPWQFIDQTGYQYFIAGENLARNYDSSKAIIEAWLGSPGHKDNLLNPDYVDTGVAIVSGDFPDKPNSVLIVQYFATKYEASQPVDNNPKFFPTSILTGPQSHPLPFNLALLFILITIIILTLRILIIRYRHQKRRSRQSPSSSHWHR